MKMNTIIEGELNNLLSKNDIKDLDIHAIWDDILTKDENYSHILGEDWRKLKELEKSKIKVEEKEFESEQLKRLEDKTRKDLNKSIKDIVKNYDSNINEYYRIPIQFIKSVGLGFNNAFIYLGSQGLGKTFSTLQTLEKNNITFVYHSGISTPYALYKFLYENRKNKVIVFDDVAGLISNEESLSVLLSALYSPVDKRIVSWKTSKKMDIPQEYEFTSRIIFITNKIPDTDYAKVIMSRCLVYNIVFSYNQKLQLMYHIANTSNGVSREERLRIMDFIKDNSDEATEDFDLRLQQKIENLYRFDIINWKDLALALLNKKNDKITILKELLISRDSVKMQLQNWSERTGLGRRMYFYYKNILK